MRFPGIRLVEQTEQQFRQFESEETCDSDSRALFLIVAPIKHNKTIWSHFLIAFDVD